MQQRKKSSQAFIIDDVSSCKIRFSIVFPSFTLILRQNPRFFRTTIISRICKALT